VEPFELRSAVRADDKSDLDVAWHVRDSAEGIVGHIGYRADLFTASTIERFVRSMRYLIAAVLKDSSCQVADLRIESNAP
jgi:hypothetical protein